LPRGSVWWLLAGTGLLETIATIASMLGLAGGHTAIVSTLISLYSMVTIVLGWLFLKERLQWSQWTGIFILLAHVMRNESVTSRQKRNETFQRKRGKKGKMGV
jgi:drug/metabolite transporter (DMT)-like permease